ncbi:D-sedoheptulose-7-phosphate isomerase [Taibaiella chishuiensis]|uniref:Phosphoheptose isomerase n=1 Tax=Taibaiella chishuiensis TaxID=1434707 RepID=A0A2P8CWG8_9BACT|nr:D-sedoheptulose 7-phosphate isomerase [Taibaiella chishuiensis]PSK89322.1 phosphoheptose isomerase [Taibaiella chishuiensis]
MTQQITAILKASVSVKERVIADPVLLATIQTLTEQIVAAFNRGNKVLFCGNGGSAADAQHLAAEFSGRFYTDRNPLPSEALHCNTSYLTAVANDYGYEFVFSRLLKGMGREGDIIVGLSTSGNSGNIIKAFELARTMGITTVGFTGDTGGKMKDLSDYLVNVPSNDTPRIQECHITIGHIVCQLVEAILFPVTEA